MNPSDFWYTPPYILDAVKSFLGDDYFDPCPIRPDADGLNISWGRDCFINPPYSKISKRYFVNKGINEWEAGDRYVWLFNYANSADLWNIHCRASAVCIPRHRIPFIPGHPELAGHPDNPDPEKRKPSGPMYDNIIILWGNISGFDESFKGIGKVYQVNKESGIL